MLALSCVPHFHHWRQPFCFIPFTNQLLGTVIQNKWATLHLTKSLRGHEWITALGNTSQIKHWSAIRPAMVNVDNVTTYTKTSTCEYRYDLMRSLLVTVRYSSAILTQFSFILELVFNLVISAHHTALKLEYFSIFHLFGFWEVHRDSKVFLVQVPGLWFVWVVQLFPG